MAYYKDLREHIAALESRGKLRRLATPINKDTELHPLVRLQFRGLREDERTAFLFENVTDSKGRRYPSPVLIGALGSSLEVYALGLDCAVEDIPDKLAKAEASPIPPSVVSSAPVHEEVHLGDRLLEHGGLGEFPIPIATPGFDPAPYISAGCWVTKDPATGIPNVGMYRSMVKSPTRTGIEFDTATKGALVHLRKCKERGRPLEAAIVIGGPPSVAYVAAMPLPPDVNEFTVAGAIAGEPVELVRCKTVDLEVPAASEVVIEGELSSDQLEPEAPFGEASGYVGPLKLNPFFTVKCITHRRRPVWLATAGQYPPCEATTIGACAYAGSAYRRLRYGLNMAHVLGVSYVAAIGSPWLMVLKLDRASHGQVWATLEEAAKLGPRRTVVAVDKDVNIHDLESVTWAVASRASPARDFRIEKAPVPIHMDYTLERFPLEPKGPPVAGAATAGASRLLIDATLKWPYPPLSLPRREFMEEALRIWQREGLPVLKLIEPWWGEDLGFFTAENAQHAAAAAKGDHYAAGEAYAKRRQPW